MTKNSKPRTRKDAVTFAKKNSAAWNQILDDYLSPRRLSKATRLRIEAMRGMRPYPGPLAASDVEAKDELCKQLIFHIDAWQAARKDVKFVFVTLFSDEFRSPKSAPIIWIRALRRKVDKTLRDVGLEGVCMLEPAALLNPPDTQRPEIHWHAHALCWIPADADVAEIRAKLAVTRSWTNCWGIPPTHVREITPKVGVAAWWARYMVKHPVDALNVIDSDGKLKLRSTTKGYRGNFALRIFEGLSQIALRDLFFSVGEGKEIRDPVWRAVSQARKRAHREMRPIKAFNRQSFWRKFWMRTRTGHKTPWKVIGSTL